MNDILLKASNIRFNYQERPVLDSVNMDIRTGDFAALIGPNGAGKTTFLKILCGILTQRTGDVLIKGEKLENYTRKDLSKIITYVPQETPVSFPYKVGEIVLMGRTPYLSAFESESEEDMDKVEQAMKQANVWELKERYFSQLSSGEKQRVILASALAQEPEILLLDEPTSNMDPKYRKLFIKILKSLKGITILFTSHNLNMTFNNFDNIFVLNRGKIVFSGTKENALQEKILPEVFETDFIIERRDNRILISPDYEK